MPEGERLYTTPEAAEMIGVSDSRLRNLIREGKASPAQRIGGTWLFALEEIERLRIRPKNKGGRPKKK